MDINSPIFIITLFILMHEFRVISVGHQWNTPAWVGWWEDASIFGVSYQCLEIDRVQAEGLFKEPAGHFPRRESCR